MFPQPETTESLEIKVDFWKKKINSSNRKFFEYKYDWSTRRIILKPFCFRWVLAYRLKELYLWVFSLVFIPFLKVADSLRLLEEGEKIDYLTLRRLHNQGFKEIRLK